MVVIGPASTGDPWAKLRDIESAPLGSTPSRQARGLGLLDGAGDSGRESSATDRNDHRIEIGNLADELEAERCGAERGERSFERMHEGPPFFALHASHLFEGLGHAVHQHDVGAVGLAESHPRGIGGLRHDHGRAGPPPARRRTTPRRRDCPRSPR
jgi:hypothetical protein